MSALNKACRRAETLGRADATDRFERTGSVAEMESDDLDDRILSAYARGWNDAVSESVFLHPIHPMVPRGF